MSFDPLDLYGEPAELLDHLDKLREQLTDAQDTYRRLIDAAGHSEPAGGYSSLFESWRVGLRYGIELKLAAERVTWWQQLVDAGEAHAQALGLRS